MPKKGQKTFKYYANLWIYLLFLFIRPIQAVVYVAWPPRRMPVTGPFPAAEV